MMCISPQTRTQRVKGITYEYTYPCGKCLSCKVNKRYAWAGRIMLEARCHVEVAFITLTYAPEHLPENGELNKREAQLFMKRLRRQLEYYGYPKIRYFLAGEYGSKNGRPHFHAILFNYPLLREDLVCSTWNKGFVDFQIFEPENAYYIAKYAAKGMREQHKTETQLLEEGKQQEFALMSRRPSGIGLSEPALAPLIRLLKRGVKLVETKQPVLSASDVWNSTYRIGGKVYKLDPYAKAKVEASVGFEESETHKALRMHNSSRLSFYENHSYNHLEFHQRMAHTYQEHDKMIRRMDAKAKEGKHYKATAAGERATQGTDIEAPPGTLTQANNR